MQTHTQYHIIPIYSGHHRDDEGGGTKLYRSSLLKRERDNIVDFIQLLATLSTHSTVAIIKI
jgi:hypothetical protein